MIFFFNDTATTEIYTLSLHDALPISREIGVRSPGRADHRRIQGRHPTLLFSRSEEHTSELQSQSNLVCPLLLEKNKRGSAPSDPRGDSAPARRTRRRSSGSAHRSRRT